MAVKGLIDIDGAATGGCSTTTGSICTAAGASVPDSAFESGLSPESLYASAAGVETTGYPAAVGGRAALGAAAPRGRNASNRAIVLKGTAADGVPGLPERPGSSCEKKPCSGSAAVGGAADAKNGPTAGDCGVVSPGSSPTNMDESCAATAASAATDAGAGAGAGVGTVTAPL